MPYQDQKPQIDEQELMDYGRRQYQDIDTSKRRLDQYIAGRYGRPDRGLSSRQWLSVAAGVLLLVISYSQLRPETNSPEIQLANYLSLEKSPLPTLGLSGFRTERTGDQADYSLALLPYSQGEFQEAIPVLKQLANQQQTPAQLHLYLGHAYFQQGAYSKATTALEQAVLQLDPNLQASEWVTARYWRAKALAADGRCEKAQKDLGFLSRPGGEFSASARELQLICEQLSSRP